MVTYRAHRRRCAVATLALAPLLATACSSGSGSTDATTTALGNAAGPSSTQSVAPSQPAPGLDPARLRDLQNGVDTVTGDKVLMDANAVLVDANARLRTVGALAPPAAKRLNDLRIGRPKDCAAIRTVSTQAGAVLGDGRAALATTSTNAKVVKDSVARLRQVLDQVRTDITGLQTTTSSATNDSRQQLETYSTAADAAAVNLSGNLTTADEATARAQRLTKTFERLASARDKALQGC